MPREEELLCCLGIKECNGLIVHHFFNIEGANFKYVAERELRNVKKGVWVYLSYVSGKHIKTADGDTALMIVNVRVKKQFQFESIFIDSTEKQRSAVYPYVGKKVLVRFNGVTKNRVLRYDTFSRQFYVTSEGKFWCVIPVVPKEQDGYWLVTRSIER